MKVSVPHIADKNPKTNNANISNIKHETISQILMK